MSENNFDKPPQQIPQDENKKEISTGEAIMSINSILQEVSVMGANDYEIPELQRIMRDVESGDMDPDEGIEQALQIKDSKQDYH